MSFSTLLPSNHLLLSAAVSASAALLAAVLNLPVLALQGLHTYIHPDNFGNDGLRAAIRRPESSAPDPEPKRRTRPNRPEFDESNAQLFRLRLVDSHLQTRLYFPQYRTAFLSSTVAASSLVLRLLLPPDPLTAAASVPVLSSLFSAFYLVLSLVKLSFERSAAKRSEKQLSILSGFLGFLFVLLIVFLLSPSVFDFELGGDDTGPAKVATAAIAGCLAGILFMPATRAARSFWLGTDQLRWNLSVVSCGPFARVLLYVAFIVNVSSPLLWINPVADRGFEEFRVWALVASAASQLLVLRPNLQMYLNEAVLCWYQRLHASRVPDLDYGRAKIFLHNYYLCLVALQFFAPPALILLFLGLSQMRGNLFSGILFIGSLADCSGFVKEMALFMAWWVVFVWAIFTMSSLALYRFGFLFVS